MHLSQRVRETLVVCCVAAFSPLVSQAQNSYAAQGGEYAVAGALAGDQTSSHAAIKPSGGYIVWQDNITDGNGYGISALKLDGNFVSASGSIRVNQQGSGDQENPRVSLLNGGGAAFVWQGGPQGFQRIYARFISSAGTWTTGDIQVNSFMGDYQRDPVIATLTNGNVIVAWSSMNQDASSGMQGVFAQRLSPSGSMLGGEFQINQFTAYNQRSPSVAALADGRFVAVWVSEQQRTIISTNSSAVSVDIYGRIFDASGTAQGNEFLINSGTNVCANPAVAAASDGSFCVAWSEKDLIVTTNDWDVMARTFSSTGFGGATHRANTTTYGDQFAPKVSASGTDYMVVWTSLGQDGSWEGVYGQFLNSSGALNGGELLVNTTTVSRQIEPSLASDGAGHFLAAWSGFVGGAASFDLFAQRYSIVGQPLTAPSAPFVSAADQRRLLVSWPSLTGYSVANYEVYADGSASATGVVTNSINMWWMTNQSTASTHTFRLAYVLTDGRRSPLSASASGTTWGYDDNFDGLPDDWEALYWGNNSANWPSPNADSDGDGVSNRDEFLAGTNPIDANSVLRQRLQNTAQGLFLTWNTQPGLVYQVQNSVTIGSWVNLGASRVAAGTNDSIYVGGSSQGFYRINRLR